MTRLILVRHAEAEGNLKRIFHGWTDADITEKGHEQAKKVAERLRDEKIDVIYSSSMKRTLKTAEYISKVKGLPIIRTDKLKEINGGDWENVEFCELPKRWPQEHYTFENELHVHQMPNGESVCEFQKRLIEEVDEIIRKNHDKSICIVTHGTAIKALLCYFYNGPLERINSIAWCDNTAVTIVDVIEGEFKVVKEGDISHLNEELSTLLNQEWYIKYQEKTKSQGGSK